MTRRLILGTGVLIKAERGKLDLHGLIGHDDPAIAAVTATEILTGVEYAAPEHRDMHALHAESLLAVFPAEPYDVNVARILTRLPVPAAPVLVPGVSAATGAR